MLGTSMRRLVIFLTLLSSGCALSPAVAQNLPALPNIPDISCGPSNGATLVVEAGGDFQRALHDAQPGDTITLANGATYTGNFVLPPKLGASCITIQPKSMTGLPTAGVRIVPATHAPLMPKLVSPNSNFVLVAMADIHHYRFIGIEFGPASGVFVYDLLSLGLGGSDITRLPHHLEFDRVYVHGDPTKGGRRGFALNSGATTIMNSHLSDFKEVGTDSQTICGWLGAGPFRLINNYLEAAGENVMFGGGPATIANLTPSDIEIRQNHFAKPLSWRGGPYSIKNLFELKHGQRILVEGNLFEHTWTHDQAHAIVFTPRTEFGANPWAVVNDITFRHNIVRHVTRAVNIIAIDGTDVGAGVRMRRVLIENNLFDDVSTATWGVRAQGDCCNGAYQLIRQTDQVTIRHNTMLNDTATLITMENGPHTQFVYKDNIARNNLYGVAQTGITGLQTNAPGYVFTNNVITELAVGGWTASMYPPNNFFPASVSAIGFVNANGGDYSLAAGSPYKNAASDGTDIGVHWPALLAAQTASTTTSTTTTSPDLTPPAPVPTPTPPAPPPTSLEPAPTTSPPPSDKAAEPECSQQGGLWWQKWERFQMCP